MNAHQKRAVNAKALAGPGAAIAGQKLSVIAMTHVNRQYEEENQFPDGYTEAWSVILGLAIGVVASWLTRDRDE